MPQLAFDIINKRVYMSPSVDNYAYIFMKVVAVVYAMLQ
jgi:hypothetical protein